jgi:Holliday junction resolvase RusA-like endonuclease
MNPDAINPEPQESYPIEGLAAEATPLFEPEPLEWKQVFGLLIPWKPRTRGSKVGMLQLHPKTKRPLRRENGSYIINMVDSDKESRPYMDRIKLLAQRHWQRRPIPEDVPVALQVCFYFARPQDHYRTDGSLRPGAPEFKLTKPDVSKTVRCLEDALTGTLYADDKQIVDFLPPFGKRFSKDEREYTELRVFIPSDRELPGEDRF